MTYNWSRLAHRIRERRADLDLTQAEVAERAGVTPMTIRNLEAAREFKRVPLSLASVEAVLEWEPGSARAILDGGEPTPRQQTVSDAVQDTDNAPAHPALAGLTEEVEFALGQGRVYGTDVIRWEVEGEQFSLILVAKSGRYDTPERRAAAKSAYETWLRVREGIQDAVDRATEGVEPQADD